ncbi:Fic family protein, partial [Corynebacterium propinquum]|uniref:Fic family protein n=1 Tax=Corynebacterium propinquum TaxID=43769 RepID=UPI002543997C
NRIHTFNRYPERPDLGNWRHAVKTHFLSFNPLFVLLAKAQPFGDGNKRTALLAANLLLLPERKILTVPYSDQDLSVSETFNDLLARAYIYDDVAACVEYLVREGVSTL